MSGRSLSPEQRELIARLLDAEGAAGAAEPIARVATGSVEAAALSAAQERLYFFEKVRPGTASYTVAGAVRFGGACDVDVLGEAVRLLVERHDALRTGFTEHEDGTVTRFVLPFAEADVPVGRYDVTRAEVDDRVRRLVSTGFDLGAAPLLNASLLRIADAEHPEWLLVLCVHHVVVDGWSLGVLAEELGMAYAAISSGERPEFPFLAFQYADYAAWQRRSLTADKVERHLAHWRERLAGVSPVDLPTDRPRSSAQDDTGAVVPFGLSADVVSSLREVADSSRATLFMVLLAGLSVVLGRWSGRADVVIGAPVAGRSRAEFDRVVGFFVNMLPLRVDYREDEAFSDLLARTRDTCGDAYANQDLPFEQILALHPDRDANGHPALVRHVLTLNNTPPVRMRLDGVDVTIEPLHTGTAKFELEVQLSPTDDGGVSGWIEYATSLFDRGTVDRISSALTTVLTAIGREPGAAVEDLPLLGEGEPRLLKAFSGSASAPLTGAPVPRWFETRVDATPSAPAVITDGRDDALSYAELDEAANRIANGLIDRGVGVEDRVGVCLHRGSDLIATVLGILKSGAAYLPLDPGYPAARLRQIAEDGKVSLIVGDGEFTPPGSTVVTVAVLAAARSDRPAVAVHPGSAAYVLFTSGSTGRPKGAVNTHAAIVNRLRWMQLAYRIDGTDRVLQKTPIGFDVSVWELLWPLMTGATLVFARPDGHRDPRYLHAVIDEHGVTTCHFVPSMLLAFADTADVPEPSLRRILCSGEELPAVLAARTLAAYPDARLHNLYGPTEAAIDVSEHPVTAPVPARVPIGRPITGVELHVLDGAYRAQPVGVPGELFIGGVQLARGYLGRPGLTAERFVPHPFANGQRLYATGDRARWLAGGELEFLGRDDDQVKIRGHRIEPGEIAAVLSAHPAVSDAFVTTHTDRSGELRLVGYATVPEPAGHTAGRLRDFLRERLPGNMVPTHLFMLKTWPIGPNGKLDRSALPVPDATSGTSTTDFVAPRTPVEEAITAIWMDLLDVERIGVEDDFFDHGGHSLLANRVIAAIRNEFTVDVPLDLFFTEPTIAALAVLTEHGLPAALPPLRRIDRELYRIGRTADEEST